MKAYVHKETAYQLTDLERPTCGECDVLIEMKAVALNRRDLYIRDRRKGEPTPLVIGSDGAGVIVDVGDAVMRWKVGDEVLINPSLRWFHQSEAPPATFDILGMPDHGTFSQYVAIHEEQVEPTIAHLNWEENASIALAGMTAYRALVTKGEVTKSDTLFIPGGSSGVATYMIQFAKAIGARVVTSSRDEKKREALRTLGADVVLDTHEDWVAALQDERVTLVIDSVGRATFQRSLEVLQPGGRFVTFGATTEDTVELDLRTFFYRQQRLIGSTMGCREELREVLRLMTAHRLHPLIGRTYTFDAFDEAMLALERHDTFGKLVITV